MITPCSQKKPVSRGKILKNRRFVEKICIQFDEYRNFIYNMCSYSEPRQFECKCVAIYIREEEAKRIPNNRYRNHVYMNDHIFVNFFGEKPHRDETLAESGWGLNRVTEK